jgi:hypothetical protein
LKNVRPTELNFRLIPSKQEWLVAKISAPINSILGLMQKVHHSVKDLGPNSPQGVNPGGLFVGRGRSRAKNVMVLQWHMEQEGHAEFISVEASEE